MAFTVATGIACGLLAGAVGLSLLSRSPPDAGRRQAIPVISGTAAVLLLAAGGIAFWEHCSEAVSGGDVFWIGAIGALLNRPLRLVLMAAVAAAPARSTAHRGPRTDTVPLLPPVVAAAVALLLAPLADLAAPRSVPEGATLVRFLRTLAVVSCSAISARALAHSLACLSSPDNADRVAASARAAYAVLTLLVGGTALASLLLRGSPWGLASDEITLGAAWLAWSAAWFGPRHQPRLRDGLHAVGSALLVLAAVL